MAQRVSGGRLRARMDEALARAGRDAGQSLEWSEVELQALEVAAETADRALVLQGLLEEELAGENRPMAVVKLSAELRLLDKAVLDVLGRVNVGPGVAKSERHVRAARSRWDRRA